MDLQALSFLLVWFMTVINFWKGFRIYFSWGSRMALLIGSMSWTRTDYTGILINKLFGGINWNVSKMTARRRKFFTKSIDKWKNFSIDKSKNSSIARNVSEAKMRTICNLRSSAAGKGSDPLSFCHRMTGWGNPNKLHSFTVPYST